MLLMSLAADICTLRQDIAQKEIEFNQEVAHVFKNLAFTPAHSPSWWERAWILLNR